MARVHFWKFIVNEAGEPIENANIYIYLAGTTTPAWVYYDEFSATGTRTEPQVSSLRNGYFEFWIDEDQNFQYGDEVDNEEATAYGFSQKFKIRWEKTGIASGTIDYVDIFPPNRYFEQVGLESGDCSSTIKNKVISNELACYWNNHVELNVLEDGLPVHGLEIVRPDEPDDFENKIITNRYGWKWDKHVDSTAQEPLTGYGLSGAVYPHNIQEVDPTNPGDLVRNKLISNNDFYLLIRSDTFDVLSYMWTPNLSGSYECTITHNMSKQFPLLSMWDFYTKEQVYIEDVVVIDENTITLTSPTSALQLTVRIAI